jgi:site-specific recombinase XerD
MGHLYKRGKRKTWYLKYYQNGKQILTSLRTSNYRIARDKAKLLEAGQEPSAQQKIPAKHIPLSDALEEFCAYLQTIRTTRSYKNEYSRLRTIFGSICPLLEYTIKPKSSSTIGPIKAKYVDGVTTDKIKKFLNMRRTKGHASATTLLRDRDIMNKFFVWASEHYGYDHNPVKSIPRPVIDAPIIRFLEKKDIDRQLRVLQDNPQLRIMVAACIFAGLRREEVVWLTHKDVDLNRRMVYIRAKEINGEHWQPKTKKNRAVPISNRLDQILKMYNNDNTSCWFFPSNGNRMHPDTFSHHLASINKKAGLEWTCLDFRHTFGSQLAKRGLSLYKISELMGNSPEICRRHYAAIRTEHLHEDVEF